MDGLKREVLNVTVLYKFVNSSNNFKTNCRNISNCINPTIASCDFPIELKNLEIILLNEKDGPLKNQNYRSVSLLRHE